MRAKETNTYHFEGKIYHVVILWVEDDVHYIDKETVEGAFTRIAGKFASRDDREVSIDWGDAFAIIYKNGWVKCGSCDGGYVGAVYSVEEENGRDYSRRGGS